MYKNALSASFSACVHLFSLFFFHPAGSIKEAAAVSLQEERRLREAVVQALQVWICLCVRVCM